MRAKTTDLVFDSATEALMLDHVGDSNSEVRNFDAVLGLDNAELLPFSRSTQEGEYGPPRPVAEIKRLEAEIQDRLREVTE